MKWVRVKKTRKRGEYIQTVGLVGCVVNDLYEELTVEFEDIKNSNSKMGYFYYSESELEFVEEEKMLEKGYRVARVEFIGGVNTKLYSFALYDDAIPDIENFGRDILAITEDNKIVIVREICEIEEAEKEGVTIPTKQLKGIFNDTPYIERVERSEKKKKLKSEMDMRINQLQREAVYELFAEKDETLKKLLEEWKCL